MRQAMMEYKVTNERTRRPDHKVDEVKRRKNRNKSKIRARVEHVFAVVKRLWGFTKVRYRGLAKNANIYTRHAITKNWKPDNV
jgi:IS5 family transposase